MKVAKWFVLFAVLVVSGCGELIFGSSDGYSLGSTSCRGFADSCGLGEDRDCCSSPLVEGNSGDGSSALTSISDFRLDRFEVTVGRFRAFVEGYPDTKPAAGDGAHPRIANSGWNSSWNSILPADRAALIKRLHCDEAFETFTDTADANEVLPINCVDWYLAFAFCAWDGGRLPTEAEWTFAAGGGDQNRMLPWSEPPNAKTITEDAASYDCLADGSDRWQCSFTDILPVGSKSPNPDGFFGQADLAGNMREWTLDAFSDSLPSPCNDCANLSSAPSTRVLHGGAWDLAAEALFNSSRNQASPGFRFYDIGLRCARDH